MSQIEQWGPIASYLQLRLERVVTKEQARHYARRGFDELPVERKRAGRRNRITIRVDAADEWCRREKGSDG